MRAFFCLGLRGVKFPAMFLLMNRVQSHPVTIFVSPSANVEQARVLEISLSLSLGLRLP